MATSVTVPVMRVTPRGKRKMVKEQYIHSDTIGKFIPLHEHNLYVDVLNAEADARARAQGMTIALH
jgi:hypothetical protein